jgi:hypothetical protein
VNAVAKGLDLALGLAAVSATILMSGCGGSSATPSPSTATSAAATATPSTAPAAIASPPPGPSATTSEQLDAWFVDGGHAELTRLTDAIVAVGHADTPGKTYAALGRACTREAAAVSSARAGPPVPDAPAQTSFASALAEYATSAADCQAGASAHSVALLNEAATATRAGTADVLRFDNQTKDAQARQAEAAAARRCKQAFSAWRDGPATAELNQLLATLKALQVAGSGKDLAAITAATNKAGQAAAQLTRLPVPVCADPGGNFAALLTRVQSAAAAAGSAHSLPAVVQALAPLKGVPTLEAQFTDEVKLTTGA